MAYREHSHWEVYHIRTITKPNPGEPTKEFLQLICIEDGIIFHEVEIKAK